MSINLTVSIATVPPQPARHPEYGWHWVALALMNGQTDKLKHSIAEPMAEFTGLVDALACTPLTIH